MTPLDHAQHIADGGARGRGHDPDTLGKNGERLLMDKIEQPFLPEPGLQLLESQLESADAFGLEVFKDKLILTAEFVDAHPAAADYLYSVLQRKFERSL
jgi:hypothetical protein